MSARATASCLALCGGLAACGKSPSLTVTVEASEIQARVSTRFPVTRDVLLSKLTLENPKIVLREGSDRIQIDLGVRAQVPLLPEGVGSVSTSGKLAYRPEQKAFYLTEASIDRFELLGLPAGSWEALRQPANAVAAPVLESMPVYELGDRDLREVTAAYVLQEVTVRDGKVYAKLGLPARR